MAERQSHAERSVRRLTGRYDSGGGGGRTVSLKTESCERECSRAGSSSVSRGVNETGAAGLVVSAGECAARQMPQCESGVLA